MIRKTANVDAAFRTLHAILDSTGTTRTVNVLAMRPILFVKKLSTLTLSSVYVSATLNHATMKTKFGQGTHSVIVFAVQRLVPINSTGIQINANACASQLSAQQMKPGMLTVVNAFALNSHVMPVNTGIVNSVAVSASNRRSHV